MNITYNMCLLGGIAASGLVLLGIIIYTIAERRTNSKWISKMSSGVAPSDIEESHTSLPVGTKFESRITVTYHCGPKYAPSIDVIPGSTKKVSFWPDPPPIKKPIASACSVVGSIPV